MKKLALFAILMLSGCASMDSADRAWYVMHAVDVAQTYQISQSDCHHEADSFTSRIIGENPSAQEVAAWGAGTAVAYTLIKDKLPDWSKYVILGYQGFTIGNNVKYGIGISSAHCDYYDQRYDDRWDDR